MMNAQKYNKIWKNGKLGKMEYWKDGRMEWRKNGSKEVCEYGSEGSILKWNVGENWCSCNVRMEC